MAANTIRLQTNIPLVGTIRRVFYNEGKEWTDPATGKTKDLPAQIAVIGEWAGVAGEARVYLPAFLADRLEELAILTVTDRGGEPQYRITAGAEPVEIMRSEDGRKKVTTINLARGDGAAPVNQRVTGTPKAPAAPVPRTDVTGWWKTQAETMKRAWAAAEYVLHESDATGNLDVTQKIAVALYIQAVRDGALVQPEPGKPK